MKVLNCMIHFYILYHKYCTFCPFNRIFPQISAVKTIYHSTHNNKWNLSVVRASLNVSARVAKSSIYYYEHHNYDNYERNCNINNKQYTLSESYTASVIRTSDSVGASFV